MRAVLDPSSGIPILRRHANQHLAIQRLFDGRERDFVLAYYAKRPRSTPACCDLACMYVGASNNREQKI
jgi:hypothetical protein